MTDAVTAPMGADATSLPDTAVPNAEYAATMTSVQHTDPVPPAAPSAKAARPDHVPEKFWDAEKGEARWEDLAKSYVELEKRGGKPDDSSEVKDDEAPPASPTDPKIERKAEDDKSAETAPLADALTAVETAYAENNGQVSDEQIAALETAGLPRKTIDTYFAGLQALQTLAMQEVHKAAGGEEKFTAAHAWATKALSDADLAYYNDNIDDPGKRAQTVEWLMGKFAAARPNEGKLVGGLTPTASSGDVYTSQSQITDAMADPRYARDEGYRKQVAEKLMRTKQAGSLSVGAAYHSRTR